jgi:hypothetical protein
VPPKQVIRSERFVATAVLTGAVWLGCDALKLGTWVCVGIAFVIGYTFGVTALYRAWEEPLASESTGVYRHDDDGPMLGRKLKGKSVRELRDLGLLVGGDQTAIAGEKPHAPVPGAS